MEDLTSSSNHNNNNNDDDDDDDNTIRDNLFNVFFIGIFLMYSQSRYTLWL